MQCVNVCQKFHNLAVCSNSQWVLNHSSMKQVFTLKWLSVYCEDSFRMGVNFREKVQSFIVSGANNKLVTTDNYMKELFMFKCVRFYPNFAL